MYPLLLHFICCGSSVVVVGSVLGGKQFLPDVDCSNLRHSSNLRHFSALRNSPSLRHSAWNLIASSVFPGKYFPKCSRTLPTANSLTIKTRPRIHLSLSYMYRSLQPPPPPNIKDAQIPETQHQMAVGRVQR